MGDPEPEGPGGGAGRREAASRRDSVLGYLEVLAAASLWGSSGIFSVYLFREGMTPASVALLRPLVGLVFLLGLVAFRRPSALRPGARGLLFLGGVGGGLTAVFQLAYQMAIDQVGVPTTVALLYLAPALVVAVSGPLLGEWPTRRRVVLAAISVVGVWLTVLGARGVDVRLGPEGIAWGITAGAGYAGYTLFGRHASRRYGSFATVLWSTAGACAFLALALPPMGLAPDLPPSMSAWLLLMAFGLCTIALASFLFYDALGRIEAGRASISSTLEPVVAALLAGWLVDQRLTASGWVGLLLVVAGVAGAYASRRSAPAPTPPPHE